MVFPSTTVSVLPFTDVYKRQMEPLMPFKYVIISPEDTSMKEGCIISEFNQCGLFLCQKGQAEILLGGRPYQINKRNLFIYTAANLLQIRQKMCIRDRHKINHQPLKAGKQYPPTGGYCFPKYSCKRLDNAFFILYLYHILKH